MRKFLALAIVMALGGWAFNRMTRKDQYAFETAPASPLEPEEPAPEPVEEPAALMSEDRGETKAAPAVVDEAEARDEAEEAVEEPQEPIDLRAAPKRRRKASEEAENWSPVVDFEPARPEDESDQDYLPDSYRQGDQTVI